MPTPKGHHGQKVSDHADAEAVNELAGDVEIESVEGYDERLARGEEVGEVKYTDAWFAELGAPTIVLMSTYQQPGIRRSIQEIVIGGDDRVPITNTTVYPWRCLCALRITANDGTAWSGTGWLVGSHTVITAGHCVYMHSHGGWVQSIEVIPGCNGSRQPYGSCIATVVRSVRGWIESRREVYDYGAIILPRNYAHGEQLGILNYEICSSAIERRLLNLSGYPGDKPTYTQWFHAREAERVTNYTIDYTIDTAPGQSGAPVWYRRDGQRYVVGIHTNGAMSGNSATRITQSVFENITNWIAESV